MNIAQFTLKQYFIILNYPAQVCCNFSRSATGKPTFGSTGITAVLGLNINRIIRLQQLFFQLKWL